MSFGDLVWLFFICYSLLVVRCSFYLALASLQPTLVMSGGMRTAYFI